jgi:hypothetical protein
MGLGKPAVVGPVESIAAVLWLASGTWSDFSSGFKDGLRDGLKHDGYAISQASDK